MLTRWCRLVFAPILWVTVTSFLALGKGDFATAQDASNRSKDNSAVFQSRFAIQAGIRKLTPGKWGMMRSEIQNESSEAAEVVSVIYFDVDPGLQFARKVWVPANSRREIWIPVLIPPGIVADSTTSSEFAMANVTTLLLDRSGESEIILQAKGRNLKNASIFSVDTKKQITVQIAGPTVGSLESLDGNTDDKIAHHTIQAMRIRNGLGEAIPNVSDARVPVVPATFDSADQIVLRGDRLADDAPGRTALREWVLNGGRLWIMLDTMEEETCQLLLGDACPIEYVDRVGLIAFQSELNDTKLSRQNDGGKNPRRILSEQEHEIPVSFVRALVDDVEVIATINGWPSIFKKEFGRGTILFTTIGARGISREKAPDENPVGMERAARLPRPELNKIAAVLFAERKMPPVSSADFAPLIQQSIGYQVPNRGAILLILGAFCIGLLSIGLWLSKSDRLGQLVWVAPMIALVASAPLILMGAVSRNSIPPTLIETQLIETTLAGDDVFVQGLAGVFENESTERTFAANTTSVFVPDRTGIKDTWRMVWSDLDQYHWHNVSMPSGLRLIPFSGTQHAIDPIRVYGTFGSDGFIGNLDGPISNLRDAFIASSTHVSLGIDVEKGKLVGPVGHSLPPGQYTTNSVLNDEQIRHQTIYRKILDFHIGKGIRAPEDNEAPIDALPNGNNHDGRPKYKVPKQPSLIAWSDGLDLGFEFNDGDNKQVSALVIVPIQFTRPEIGETIQVPSVFLPYETVGGPNNEGKSIAYNGRTGTWQKRSRGSASNIRFQLPHCIQPFDLKSARLQLKINAPSRLIQIQTGQRDELIDIASDQSPVRKLEYVISDPAALRLDEDGGLHVRILVGEVITHGVNQQEIFSNVDWKIDYVELQIEGQVVPSD